MTTPFGDFGAPPDAVAWVSLLLAAVTVTLASRPAFAALVARVPERRLVAALAAFAAALSFVYLHAYLRGGPRIVDATTYFLQARTLSEGHVGAVVPSPTGAFRGRFLLASADGHTLYGIFPPGYPAILAVGFLLGAPLAVGPLIAAALVVATYGLAIRLLGDRRAALLAAALSATSAVLRYHTADTMSHGWAALLFAVALTAALGRSLGSALVAGVALGWLVATRPVTGVVACAVVAAAVFAAPLGERTHPGRSSRLRVVMLALGALGPLALFLAEQRVATGRWLGSTQLAYYALADGPPGCFRYGFGRGIGCVFEHGDFVRARLADGYGLLAAAGTTLRRLKMHLADAGNCELFAPVLVYGLVIARRDSGARLAALGVVAIVVAYVPFYFDGNYPGGGARFYADVLPLEHALLGLGLVRLGLSRLALPVALTGFALHTAYDHERLAVREGGRPLYEESTARKAGIVRGLVFVDTDHGFNLGFDPRAKDAESGIVVARRRHDAHDALLWAELGEPAAYAYEQSLSGGAPPARLVPLDFAMPSTLRFEGEAEWPPLDVRGGSVEPTFPACASLHRALALHPAGSRLLVRLAAPGVSAGGRYRITTAWVTPASGRVQVQVTLMGISSDIARDGAPGACLTDDRVVALTNQSAEFIEFSATSEQALDYVEVAPASIP